MKRSAEDEGKKATKEAKTLNVPPTSAPSSDASGTTNLSDVVTLLAFLQANGIEDQYDAIKDEIAAGDPPVLFEWRRPELEAFLRAIQDARDQDGAALPPCPLDLPPVLTVDSFIAALLNYAHVQGSPAVANKFSLYCSIPQCMRLASKLRRLDLQPWSLRVIEVGGANMLPIATVGVLRPQTNILDFATEPYRNSLFGPDP